MSKTAKDLLDQAHEILCERGKQYDKGGKQERSMPRIVRAFNAAVGRDGQIVDDLHALADKIGGEDGELIRMAANRYGLTPMEGWAFMQQLKMVRQYNTPDKAHPDSNNDKLCYAVLEAEEWESFSDVKMTSRYEAFDVGRNVLVGANNTACDVAEIPDVSNGWIRPCGCIPNGWHGKLVRYKTNANQESTYVDYAECIDWRVIFMAQLKDSQ